MKRTVVLFSGGLDSATCLALEVDNRENEEILALSFSYGQLNAEELKKAATLCRNWNVPHIVQTLEVGDSNTLHEIPVRNLQFIVAALKFALTNGYNKIVIGAEPDSTYLDSSYEYLLKVHDLLNLYNVDLVYPVKSLKDKSVILTTALNMGVPLDLVHSSLTNYINYTNKTGARFLNSVQELFPRISSEILIKLIEVYHAGHHGTVFDINGGEGRSFKFIPALFTFAGVKSLPSDFVVYTTGNWGREIFEVFRHFAPLRKLSVIKVDSVEGLSKNILNTDSDWAQWGIKQALSRLPRPRYIPNRLFAVKVTQGHLYKALKDLGYEVCDAEHTPLGDTLRLNTEKPLV